MDNPPELNVKIPQRKDLPHKAQNVSENFVIDFLLLTAVECELLSCFYYLQDPFVLYDEEIGYVFVGKMGDESEEEKLTVGLKECNKGPGVGGSAMTVQRIVTALKPKAVFCVGFCGGMNPDKAELGDVVVSAKLGSYALRKVTEGGIEPRGTIVPLNRKLNDIMKHANNGWRPPLKTDMAEKGPRVVLGTMLSGPMLVNSENERDTLLQHYPDAIAIEMEGEGVYAAAHDLQIGWVVVKGISDYADGTKDSTKDWKPFASVMAASLVAHALSQPSIFKSWTHYGAGSLPITLQCATATSRDSAKQDLPKNKQKVERFMKEIVVDATDKFDLSSKEELCELHKYLKRVLELTNISSEGRSIKINVTCRSLEILEGLWDDYCSGHLNAKAEECLITEKVKDELGMENITLTTTILEEDYLACKLSLRKILESSAQRSASPLKRPLDSSPGSQEESSAQRSASPLKRSLIPPQVPMGITKVGPAKVQQGPPMTRPKRSSPSSVSKQHIRGSTKRGPDSQGSPEQSTAGPSKKRGQYTEKMQVTPRYNTRKSRRTSISFETE